MSEVVVTVQDWREAFPEFANAETYPDGYLQRFLTQAQSYISTQNYRLSPQTRILAIELMSSHLLTLSAVDAQGNPISASGGVSGGIIAGATIDGVSVQMVAPIAADAFEQWIQSTPYGKQYWALLTANNPTGVYYLGNPRVWGIR